MSLVLGSLNTSNTSTNSIAITDTNGLPPHPPPLVASAATAGPSSGEDPPAGRIVRQLSLTSFDHDSDDETEGNAIATAAHGKGFVLGPLLPLKQQLERDKEDESLRRWKQQLLGSIGHLEEIEDGVDTEVKVLGLSILSPGRQDMEINLPSSCSYKNHLFTLKEGSLYSLKFAFSVHRNIVSGLTYVHTVWKNGIRVDNSRVMLGTFAPQREPHVVLMEEETTPSGILARGSYSAKTKFIDDDGRCHFEIEHTFDIRKDW